MHYLGLIVAVGSLAAAVLAGFALLKRHPRHGAVIARIREPRSLVEVLRTPEVIADAARRAAAFERDAATRSNERVERYDAIAASAVDQRAEATVHDIGQRSA